MSNAIIHKILENDEYHESFRKACGVYFLDKPKASDFTENGEVYSQKYEVFALDASGGEYVFLEDGTIGHISSEGDVGRIAENLQDFIILLFYTKYFQDFTCEGIYKKKGFLAKMCEYHIGTIHKDDEKYNINRGEIAEYLGFKLDFANLPDILTKFYQTAIRSPRFSSTYTDPSNNQTYTCDTLIDDVMSIWILDKFKLTRKEFENLEDI